MPVFHSGRDKVFVANVSKITTFNENVLDSPVRIEELGSSDETILLSHCVSLHS